MDADGAACIIRADGASHLGMGHVMRCLALAEGLRERGTQPLFVTRDHDAQVAARIRAEGHAVEQMPAGYDFADEMRFVEARFAANASRMLIADLCNVDTSACIPAYASYLHGWRSRGVFVLAFDDLNWAPYADVVVNPNYGAEDVEYAASDGTELLLGPDYFLLRQEFRSRATDRELREPGERVLVTMGGSDLAGLTPRVMRAMLKVRQPLEVRVVAGIEDRERTGLTDLSGRFEGRCALYDASCNMAELMRWADVAVTGGGLTKYEAAATGTPAVVLAQVEHQHELMQRFAKAGTSSYLGRGGEVSEEAVRDVVESLLGDLARRRAMSQAGTALVDGKGLDRVLAAVAQTGSVSV